MKSVQTLDLVFCMPLIGKEWKSGACGPQEFDCWGLLRFIYKERRGIELPVFAGIDSMGLLNVVKTVEDLSKTSWAKIREPEHFCAVGVSSNRRVHHVGIWLDLDEGGILHCAEKCGVVFQNQIALRQAGLQNLTYYKLQTP